MNQDTNKNAGIKICVIFYNCPEESFTYKQMLERSGFPEGTVKSRINRLVKSKIIKRYRTHYKSAYSYKLLDIKKAKEYIEGRIDSPNDKKKRFTKRRDTPTLPVSTILDKQINGIPHHKIQQVKLTDEEWFRTEHLFTKAKDNRDRGNQRTLERKSFKLVISPNTLKGALYILEDNWKGELQMIYPELAEQIHAKDELSHLGVSFDAEVWQNFRIQSEDMKLLFATSHFWRELDVEGREVAVNSFMQHIMRDSFDKTTYDAINSKLMEQILMGQEGFDQRMFQQVEILQKIDEKLDKLAQNEQKMIEILDRLTERLTGTDKPNIEKKEKVQEIKVFTPDDNIMFG